MKLDRNSNPDGWGKYALLKLRVLNDMRRPDDPFAALPREIADAIKTLEDVGAIEWGAVGSENEFFVIKLKDKYAQAGLAAYAREAVMDDAEYGGEVWELARRAGPGSKFCKKPD